MSEVTGRDRALRRRVDSFTHDGETYHLLNLTARYFDDEMSGLVTRVVGDDIAAAVELAARFACYCLCDEDGTRLFKDDELELVRAEVDMSLLNALVERALVASGITEATPSGN